MVVETDEGRHLRVHPKLVAEPAVNGAIEPGVSLGWRDGHGVRYLASGSPRGGGGIGQWRGVGRSTPGADRPIEKA
jgi:hypothetical protein